MRKHDAGPQTIPMPHHLSDAARVITVGLVDLRLQHGLHVPRLDTDHW